jgi:hypothetical protein
MASPYRATPGTAFLRRIRCRAHDRIARSRNWRSAGDGGDAVAAGSPRLRI